MDLQITQTKDDTFNGYVRRYIFGLNIFPDSHPMLGSRSDPRIIFLREIALQHTVAGVIDNDADGADRLQIFLPAGRSELVANSLVRGEIIGPAHPLALNGLFFPKVPPELFDFEEIESDGRHESVAFHILYSDALALFVSPKSEDASSKLSGLLKEPFTSSGEFLLKAIELYEIVITSYADVDFFGCFAKNKSIFEILNKPLDAAVTEIKDSVWFQESNSALVWDGRESMCLVEKDKMT